MPRTAKKPLNEAFNTGHAAAKTAPGLPYGQRQALEQSMQAVPTPGPQSTTASASGGPGVLADPIADAQNTPFQPVGMFNPTQQPDTPVTAGLATGPGPGPEALAPPPNPDAQALSSLVPLLEILSSSPQSTMATRNFLRTIQQAGA